MLVTHDLNRKSKEQHHSGVEKIGRICYKSDPKGKPEEFVQKLVRSGHTAMIEHFWVHLTYHGDWETLENQIDNLMISSAQYI